jgi:hypothetical protein
MKHPKAGQSLIEVLVAVAVGGLIIGSATIAISVALRANLQSKSVRSGSFLLQEMMDNVRSIAEGNWHTIYDLSKGPSTSYYVTAALGVAATPETPVPTIDGVAYSRHFSVENVQRSYLDGPIVPSGIDDPSTQKITGYVTWTGGSPLSAIEYIARTHDRIQKINDWSDPGTYSSQSGLNLSTPGQATLP